ncbi:hypothetical protein [Pseudonocardia acaciae]|uniref:hypothetical protein n=1 Tax=Pseudonocardia acaciae TaxID=551276 RepID=UPI0012EEBD2F|nr:hypothetical protein [Pseudonocardia acaciae]
MTRPSDATRGSGSNSTPTAVPGNRQPLPGPPGGPQGGFRPGPRFAPAPPPRRRLTPAQGSRLGLISGLIVVLGAAAGLAVTLLVPTLYAARTDIEYTVSRENASEFLRTDRNLTTQTVLITSRTVLGPVADANGVSPDELTGRVSAKILMGKDQVTSEVIEVTVLDPDRQAGVKLADDVAKQYLKVFSQNGPKAYLQAQLDEARRQLASAPAATAPQVQTRINTLQGQLDTVNIAGNRAAILVPAYSVSAPAYPNPMLFAATGALCGLVVAALVAIALSRRWTRS